MKLPEPVMWASDKSQSMWGASDESGHPFHIICKGRKVRSHQISLFTEAQLREALAQQAEDLKQLQEQNTALDAKLAQQEAVMRQALEALEVIHDKSVFEYSLPSDHYASVAAMGAIKALEEALK